jgi:hypothetical protein
MELPPVQAALHRCHHRPSLRQHTTSSPWELTPLHTQIAASAQPDAVRLIKPLHTSHLPHPLAAAAAAPAAAVLCLRS